MKNAPKDSQESLQETMDQQIIDLARRDGVRLPESFRDFHGYTVSYAPIIFPTLAGKKWANVDLGGLANAEFKDTSVENPLLDPITCDTWVREIAEKYNADFTWGGYAEDRKTLWRGYYKDAEFLTHLGVDYNVPVGTPVAAPVACEVVHVWADKSTENGWGGRLILKLSTPWHGAHYLIYGHLAHESLPNVGAFFEAADVVAVTGTNEENGGWFPHLHVQCASDEYFQEHTNRLEMLDGYHLAYGETTVFAPDPTMLVGRETVVKHGKLITDDQFIELMKQYVRKNK